MSWIILLFLAAIIAYSVYEYRKNKQNAEKKEQHLALINAQNTSENVRHVDKDWRIKTGEYCYQCHYWDAGIYRELLSPDEIGECNCKRNPPFLDSNGEAVWPSTGPFDWCGEFKGSDCSKIEES